MYGRLKSRRAQEVHIENRNGSSTIIAKRSVIVTGCVTLFCSHRLVLSNILVYDASSCFDINLKAESHHWNFYRDEICLSGREQRYTWRVTVGIIISTAFSWQAVEERSPSVSNDQCLLQRSWNCCLDCGMVTRIRYKHWTAYYHKTSLATSNPMTLVVLMAHECSDQTRWGWRRSSSLAECWYHLVEIMP